MLGFGVCLGFWGMLGFLGGLGVGRGEVRSAGERSTPLRCWVGVLGFWAQKYRSVSSPVVWLLLSGG